MSIDIFLDEIENRKTKEITDLDKELDDKQSEVGIKKNTAIKELQEHFSKEAKTKSEKEASRIVEAGKLEAKKILFDAINKNLDSTFDMIKQELGNYTKNLEYEKILQKMVETSKKKLDNNITIHCRKEDQIVFNSGDVTVGSPIQTLGGIIAENNDGTKELDLTFEELLRTHEDEIKNTILEKIMGTVKRLKKLLQSIKVLNF
jgi:V/A-type H+-transporting ATPase subunit E